jgi:hypothetical protein
MNKTTQITNSRKKIKHGNSKTETEKMLYHLFRLCDETVWVDDWPAFMKSFEKILKKFGYDIYSIYFGRNKTDYLNIRKKEIEKLEVKK